MDELIAFVRAQLVRQEAALIAFSDHRGVCQHAGYQPCEEHVRTTQAVDYINIDYGLADIAAKRLILDECDSGIEGWTHPGEKERCRDIVRLLAQPYADRPGYREEWRV